MKTEIIDKYSSLFPDLLKEIPDCPEKLYCLGDYSLLKTECISVVGTRRSSPYGRWAAYEISKRISERGITVVSGMAEGIDSQAHIAVLESKGKTIAVLGCGVNVCFPKSNGALYRRIKENGLLISEYNPYEPARNYYFPLRNRIISGLSKSVIVVEGAIKSGSMITANLALTQGRDVYAVPGNINQPNSIGVNMLIRDGAIPILSIDEVCSSLGIKEAANKRALELCSEEEIKILEAVNYEPGISAELIAYKCGIGLSETNILITGLELKSFLRRDACGIYICEI